MTLDLDELKREADRVESIHEDRAALKLAGVEMGGSGPDAHVPLAALRELIRLAEEAAVLRAVAEAACDQLNARGSQQLRTPLHDALSAYYRWCAENRKGP